MYNKIYLNVPYAQKDQAKALGAKWDQEVKKWFFEGSVDDIAKFGKWILSPNQDSVIIAYEGICLIEAKRKCYRCGKETRIIGFGICEHSILQEDNGEFVIEDPDDYPDIEDDISLAWPYNESDVPPLLLRYITKHYNVRTGYSRGESNSFANHCDHCGSIQGNNYLFKADSPLSTQTPIEEELIGRMTKLNVYNIYTDCALALDWNIAYCSNDWAYMRYCKFKDVIISEKSKEMYTPYAEMYDLI